MFRFKDIPAPEGQRQRSNTLQPSSVYAYSMPYTPPLTPIKTSFGGQSMAFNDSSQLGVAGAANGGFEQVASDGFLFRGSGGAIGHSSGGNTTADSISNLPSLEDLLGIPSAGGSADCGNDENMAPNCMNGMSLDVANNGASANNISVCGRDDLLQDNFDFAVNSSNMAESLLLSGNEQFINNGLTNALENSDGIKQMAAKMRKYGVPRRRHSMLETLAPSPELLATHYMAMLASPRRSSSLQNATGNMRGNGAYDDAGTLLGHEQGNADDENGFPQFHGIFNDYHSFNGSNLDGIYLNEFQGVNERSFDSGSQTVISDECSVMQGFDGRDKSLFSGKTKRKKLEKDEVIFKCEYPGCGKTFDKLQSFKSHETSHSSDRPFACSQCDLRFRRNHDLKRHERIHAGYKPYICVVCNKSFLRLDALNRHMKVNNGQGCKKGAPKRSSKQLSAIFKLLIMESRGPVGCCQLVRNIKKNKVAPAPIPADQRIQRTNTLTDVAKTPEQYRSANSLSWKSRPGTAASMIAAVRDTLAKVVTFKQPEDSWKTRSIKAGELRVWIGTWNMHGKPPPETLEPFIMKPKSLDEDPDVSYHIMAIGTQECERSIEKSVIYPSKGLWEQKLKQYLGDRYTMIDSETMAAIHLCIFVLTPLVTFISDLESAVVATGIGNVVGNKGGVGIGFKLNQSASFLFVTSHFSAHQKNVNERNNDFARICKELKLKGNTSRSQTGETDVTRRFDYTFWFGDLNYRVNGTRKMVDELLGDNMLETLLSNDQLRLEMENGAVFKGFKEPEITFLPTYKFDLPKKVKRAFSISQRKRSSSGASVVNQDSDSDYVAVSPIQEEELSRDKAPEPLPSPTKTNLIPKRSNSVYDSSKKQRIPSWTDRILFKEESSSSQICATKYDACMDMMHSDHKPVYAIFSMAFDWRKVFDNEDSKRDLTSQKNRCVIL